MDAANSAPVLCHDSWQDPKRHAESVCPVCARGEVVDVCTEHCIAVAILWSWHLIRNAVEWCCRLRYLATGSIECFPREQWHQWEVEMSISVGDSWQWEPHRGDCQVWLTTTPAENTGRVHIITLFSSFIWWMDDIQSFYRRFCDWETAQHVLHCGHSNVDWIYIIYEALLNEYEWIYRCSGSGSYAKKLCQNNDKQY